ncbi:SLC13 family permease [Odoribacter sp. OttesenSCG-928-G04]|nr:SLC13 family permease [Odoribacter sp. OttesenSCG-928-G04]
MITTIIVLVISAIFFMNGKVRADLVALCALLALMLFNILTPEEALSGFSSSVVIMMIGLFVIGGAIFQTGLAKMISTKVMGFAGTSQTKLFILVILVTASIGAFVSNTGTVALMLPIVVTMASLAGVSPSRFLMPMAFASSMGGMMTLIGTPPNLIINDTLIKAGYESLSFFTFLPLGLICVATGIIFLLPLSKVFLSKDKQKEGDNKKSKRSLKELANEYQLAQNLYRVKIVSGSELADKRLADLNITEKYNITILEIRRRSNDKKPFMKTINQKIAGPDTVINNNDILYVMGAFENAKLFVSDNKLEFVDPHETEQAAPTFSGNLRFDEIGIAEVVVLSNSKLINHPIKDSGFRSKYNVNVLGIQRSNHYILQDLKNEKIQAGDALLVQGEWGNINRLHENDNEWVVVGQPMSEASKITLDHKAPLAAIIMLAMIVCMVINIIPAVTAVIAAAILMVLTGCFRNVEEAYKTINWESIVLIGAMIPMSIALEKTGTATLISSGLVETLGSYGPRVLLAGIYLGTSLLTLFISNTATAVLFAPIAMSSAMALNVSPYPFLFAVTVAASMCFASPFSTPPNALVMSAGRYTFMDYVKVGVPLQLIFAIIMVLVLPLLFPF